MLSALRCFAVLLAVSWVSSALAVSAFDNFGDGDVFDPTGGLVVSGPGGLFGQFSSGLQFTSSVTGFVSQLVLPLSAKDNGRPNDGFRVTLHADDGNWPGAALESLVLNDICYVDFDCEQGQLHSIDASGTTELTAGTPYWLIASADEENADFLWYFTDAVDPASVYIASDGFEVVLPFVSPPALRVSVIPDSGGNGEIPEPPALLVLSLLIGTGLSRSKRRTR